MASAAQYLDNSSHKQILEVIPLDNRIGLILFIAELLQAREPYGLIDLMAPIIPQDLTLFAIDGIEGITRITFRTLILR